MNWDLLLIVLAAVCFLAVAAKWDPIPRINLLGLGLFFWILTILVS